MCGYEYARTELKNAVVLLQISGACAFLVTAWHARQRRLSAWGLCGLAISVVLAGLLIFFKMQFGVDDSP
jgi:hypothetical protein